MRKLLAFVLLFGGGLLVLWQIEKRAASSAESAPKPILGGAELADENPTEPGIKISGRADLVLYAPGAGRNPVKRTFLRIVSRDSRTQGQTDILERVQAELFDTHSEDRSKQADILADSALLTRELSESDLEPRHMNRVLLRGLKATFLRRIFLAPLTFEAPEAVLDARDPTNQFIESEHAFRISSPRLDGGGEGVVMHLDNDLLEVKNKGWIVFHGPSKDGDPKTPQARFSSEEQGALQLRTLPGTEPRVFVAQAWEGALLNVTGERPALLTATETTLRSSSRSENEEGALTLDGLEASGKVFIDMDGNLFQGDAASVRFDAEGALQQAMLRGLPHAVFPLQVDEIGRALGEKAGEAPESMQVDVTGTETLEVRWEDGYHVTLVGPTTLVATGLTVRAAQGLTGFRSEDGRSARFVATGGVVLETDRGTLETADLVIELEPDARGGLRFRGTASHGARIVGTLADGRPFTTTTPDTMVVAGTRENWIVQKGTQIEVSVGEPEGFFARADRVENVDLQHLSLTAFGNVHYRSSAQNRSYRLDTDQLRIAGEELTQEDGAVEQRFIVEASGNVRGDQGAKGRTTAIKCEHLLAVHTEIRGSKPLQTTSRLDVTGNVDATVFLRGELVSLKADEARVERSMQGDVIIEESLFADGSVEFEGERGFPFKGSGDRLVLDGDRTGRLVSHEGRITLQGKLQGDQMPFQMTADEVIFSEEVVHAVEPSMAIANYRLRAKRLERRGEVIELFGDVHASGYTPRDVPWTLFTQRLLLEGRASVPASGDVAASEGDLRAIHATEGVRFNIEGLLRAEGESFEWKKIHGTMRVEGKPVRAFSSVARSYLETEWIEFDPSLQMITGTGLGKVIPINEMPEPAAAQEEEVIDGVRRASFHRQQEQEEPLTAPDPGQGTTIDFLSTRTQVDGAQDSLVFMIQEPVFHSPATGTILRASWAVFWIDRTRWLEIQDNEREGNAGIVENLRRSFDGLERDARARGPLSDLIDGFRDGPLSGLLREMYFEGPVEYVENSDLLFRADAVYVDAQAGRGWLAGATVNVYGRKVDQSFEKLIVKAQWLRHSADGGLRADEATVTSCTFDDPHLQVVTGDLRIYPLGDSVETAESFQDEIDGAPPRNGALFRLIMKDNRIELYDTLRIPLPTIDLKTDHKFKPLWQTLSLANSARFGTLFSLGASIPAGKSGELLNDAISANREKPFDASFEIEGSYLGSRGGHLDVGLESRSNKNYDFNIYTGVIYDRDEDKGFVRVDEEDRGQFRYWLRSFGHFERGQSTLTFTLSHMSDAAVQSEFYEREFLTYERDETYLQWYRAENEWFSQITMKSRVDDFQSQIEELPSASTFRSRAPAFRVGDHPIQWVGDASVEYLRRLEADIAGPDLDPFGQQSNYDPLISPFGLASRYPDQLGEREVLRVDTTQTLEAPIALNTAGLRLTPFVSARGTFWSEGVDTSESPARGIAEAGARLATSFWRANSDGTIHQLVPYMGVRSELVREDEDVPVSFDEVDRVLTGDIFELGTRGRFGLREGLSFLDFDLQARYAAGRSDGAPDGWLPFGTFTRLNVSPWGRRLELWYDARYDFEEAETNYSLVSIGTRFGDRFGLQAGHQRGRDFDGDSLFEAATVEGIFRWTEKWEFEARQAFSLLDDQELDLRLAVRRYGHDVVLDLETSVREGEGTSFGISLRPRFGYKRPRVGYVPW